MKERGQQEIAGFVIIVVLVVIAAFIFMVLSQSNKDYQSDSVEVSNLLNALWDHTSECVVKEPLPLSVGELIEEAYGMNPQCKDMGKSSKDYLNETISSLMDDVLDIEPRFNAYQIVIYDLEETPLSFYSRGSCGDQEILSADRIISGKLRVLLRICLNVND